MSVWKTSSMPVSPCVPPSEREREDTPADVDGGESSFRWIVGYENDEIPICRGKEQHRDAGRRDLGGECGNPAVLFQRKALANDQQAGLQLFQGRGIVSLPAGNTHFNRRPRQRTLIARLSNH